MAKKNPNTFKLLGALPGQTMRLVRTEIANAKAEVAGGFKNLLTGVALIVVALVLFFWAIPVFITAAIAGIAEALPVWLSALIIGGATLLVIVIVVLIAVSFLKRASIVPKETIARVQGDLDAAQHVVDNVDQMTAKPGKKGTQPGEKGTWR